MTDEEIFKLFNPLWADLQEFESFPKKRPLVAHYTSISVLEAMLLHNEIWFSNPLLMNDWEEVSFGIQEGIRLFMNSPEIESASQSTERFELLRSALWSYYITFVNEHMPDTYVLCFSKHEKEDTDGLLSMWRGYGGNGKGVAIVLDTAKIPVDEQSPLFIISHVHYGTVEQRREYVRQRYILQFAEIIKKSALPDEKLYIGSRHFFERIKLFALFTKHRGFKEEREWRVVYMRDRDYAKKLEEMLDYWIGPRGAEPKLKLKIEALPSLAGETVTLSQLIDRIILGPSFLSTPLARSTIFRMLDVASKPELKDRIKFSTIPFRAP
jgi:hypothetical protein